jgi:hypothetical protein
MLTVRILKFHRVCTARGNLTPTNLSNTAILCGEFEKKNTDISDKFEKKNIRTPLF